MGNPFVHVELMSTDVGKAKSFYGELFDWKLEDMNMGDMTYTMIKVGEGTGGGLMKNPVPNAPSMWVAYVNVDDVKGATAKAKSLGATVMKDVHEIKGAGAFSTSPTRRVPCSVFGSRKRAESGSGCRLTGSGRGPMVFPWTCRISPGPSLMPSIGNLLLNSTVGQPIISANTSNWYRRGRG